MVGQRGSGFAAMVDQAVKTETRIFLANVKVGISEALIRAVAVADKAPNMGAALAGRGLIRVCRIFSGCRARFARRRGQASV